MAKVVLWHNPRCSKSREAKALLEERGVELSVRLYLKDPPDEKTLKATLKKLGLKANEILRAKEEAAKELGLGPSSKESEVLKAMVKHPILIERPIAIVGERAVVGRPPERVLKLVD